MTEVIKEEYGTYHFQASCSGCEFLEQAQSEEQKEFDRIAQLAKEHAEKEGHLVMVEQISGFAYKPKS